MSFTICSKHENTHFNLPFSYIHVGEYEKKKKKKKILGGE
jgi:hypothetical protein